jgi:hypothetical protein
LFACPPSCSRRQSTHLGYKISRAGATVSRSLSEMINSKY